MSFIWNVLLSISSNEFWYGDEEAPREKSDALETVNKWLAPSKLADLTKPTFKSSYGMEAYIYGGGFKRFDVEGFIEMVAVQSWHDPDNVQLFLKAKEQERFKEYPLFKPEKPKPRKKR